MTLKTIVRKLNEYLDKYPWLCEYGINDIEYTKIDRFIEELRIIALNKEDTHLCKFGITYKDEVNE